MEYKPGDVVNGHVLGTDNQWHPVQSDAPAGPPTGPTGAWQPSVAPAANPAKGKRKPWWVWAIAGLGALILISIIGSALGGGQKSTSSTPAAPAAAPSSAAKPAVPAPSATANSPAPQAPPAAQGAPGLNQPVRDGKLEFVITGVDCSKTKIGDQYLNQTAQGKYCLVAMKVTNISNEPQTFFGSVQTTTDAQGRKFEPDSAAAFYLKDSKSLFEKINPGNSVTGTVVFDIPKDATLVEMELHDGAFSGGVKVKLA